MKFEYDDVGQVLLVPETAHDEAWLYEHDGRTYLFRELYSEFHSTKVGAFFDKEEMEGV